MSSDRGELDNTQWTVIDRPFEPTLDGCLMIRQDNHFIFIQRERAEQLAIDLMREYGLAWWPEPQEDALGSDLS